MWNKTHKLLRMSRPGLHHLGKTLPCCRSAEEVENVSIQASALAPVSVIKSITGMIMGRVGIRIKETELASPV